MGPSSKSLPQKTAPEGWIADARQSKVLVELFQQEQELWPKLLDAGFPEWVERLASNELWCLRAYVLTEDEPARQIDWELLLNPARGQIQRPPVFLRAINLVGQLLRNIGQFPDLLPGLYTVLYEACPSNPIPDEAYSKEGDSERRLAKLAFDREEALPTNGSSSSQTLLDEIDNYIEQYYAETGFFLAPYTSLVGPSGMGKSFAVKQLAKVHSQYVLYISLAPPGTAPIPEDTLINWRHNITNVYGIFLDLRPDEDEDRDKPGCVQWLPQKRGEHFRTAVAIGCDATVFPVLARDNRLRSMLQQMLLRSTTSLRYGVEGLRRLVQTRDGTSLLASHA